MSIRKAMLFVPRRLLASYSWPAAAPLASSSATDAATALSLKQRDAGWAPLSAVAAASGAASPLGVAAVLVAPTRKQAHLVVKPPPVGWKPAPKPLPMGIVPSSALRKAPPRGKTVVVTSQTMHRAVPHLTADCRASVAPAPPPPATVGRVRKRRSPRHVLGVLSRSLLLVGALLIAGMPPVLAA